jgi:hypothetical protein
MRAAVYRGAGTMEITDLPVPEPGPHDLLPTTNSRPG